jgi:hypothetical protein
MTIQLKIGHQKLHKMLLWPRGGNDFDTDTRHDDTDMSMAVIIWENEIIECNNLGDRDIPSGLCFQTPWLLE